jgi:hypothetical protein
MGGGMSIEMWLAENGDNVKEHALQQRVCDALAAEPGLEVEDMRVTVQARVVTLSGGVQRYSDRLVTERVAGAVPGVQAVRNGLVVRRAEGCSLKRWLGIIALLCLGGMTTLAAQQAGVPLRAVPGSVVQVSSPSLPVAGPRLTPTWPRFEPAATHIGGAADAMLATPSDDPTTPISTLGLAIIGLIVLLLAL